MEAAYKFYPNECRVGKFEELKHLKGKAAKEGVVMDAKTDYIVFEVQKQIVAFAGYMPLNSDGSVIRFKSDWVHPDWRKQGIYKIIFDARLAGVKAFDVCEINAFCTKMSLPVYLANGFETVMVNGRGSTFVKLMLK